jgi:FemAB-related protein (PEP-CTERM system-associated)
MLPLRNAVETPVEAIEVGVVTPDAQWDAYVASRPEATGYHLAAWAPVFREAFGHDSRYLAARAGGAIVGILPLVTFKTPFLRRFCVSLPFLNYGGIVADHPDAEQALLAAAIAESRAAGASFLELRHSRRRFPSLPAKQHKVAMWLPLETSVDAQWAKLDRKVRNQVRKAEKNGLRATRGGLDLVDAFYDVFARNMRDLGTPVYTRRWFRQILATFPDRAGIVCVWRGEEPVAASFTFRHRDSLEVPWASSLRAHNALCGNILLYWEMLRAAVEGGCARFDFGRSSPGSNTFEFKRQWGAEPHAQTWEYWLAAGGPLPDMSPQNPRVQLAVDLWRRLPLAVTRAVGPWIVRNIP